MIGGVITIRQLLPDFRPKPTTALVSIDTRSLPPVYPPYLQATMTTAFPPGASATVAINTPVAEFITLAPIVLPATFEDYQRAAFNFILHHEGQIPETYVCPKGARTIGAGLNIEANPTLLSDVFGVDFALACDIADGKHQVSLDRQGIERLLEQTLLKKEKIARQKMRNRGFDFDRLELRARLVVLDLCYHRPNFLDNEKFLRDLSDRNYRAAATHLVTSNNRDRHNPNLAGLAMRNVARAYILDPALFNGKNPQKNSTSNETRAWQTMQKRSFQAEINATVAGLPPLSAPPPARKRSPRQR